MSEAFVPMFDPPRAGKQSANVGWIVAENGCHLWQASGTSDGYGMVQVGGRKQLVHRVRYQREVGPIPAGMVLDHFVCDNRICCNPHHVRPATRRENTLRGETVTAANAAKTHCPHGHPLSGSNVYAWCGSRICRACQRASERSYRARAAGGAA